MTRQRQDWVTFFRLFARLHGVRIRLTGFDSSAPEVPRTEKRLVRIVRSRSVDEPFALRRSYASGPSIIDCLFSSAVAADDLAEAIGAAPIKPPIGWATARELVADGHTLRRLWKQGAQAPRLHAGNALSENGPTPPIVSGISVISSLNTDVPAATADPISEARSRLAKMPLEEQAAALFRSMMDAR